MERKIISIISDRASLEVEYNETTLNDFEEYEYG